MKSKAWHIVLLVIAIGLTPIVTMADGQWHAEHRDRDDFARFHKHDINPWATGRWVAGDHNGQSGWWWVVRIATGAELWYSYNDPIYPYSDPYVPPTTMREQQPIYQLTPVPQPAPYATWYFCASSGKYYPYVAVCPEGWKAVPAPPQ